ncbi:MAG: pyridoxal-phosphate dependent enzyme, partial [Pseudomonadota bacterium]
MNSKLSASPVEFSDVLAATERLRGLAVHTPLLSNPTLDAMTGANVLLKPECLQRTGSFKFRGACNRLGALS